MITPNTSGSPARLYALLLRLRPLRQGTIMPFVGEMVHAAFLSWLRSAAPDVSTWLHDGQKRRFFTCSNLHFSPSMQPNLRVERENIHMPLDPQKTYTLRLTLLLGELFPVFHEALMQFNVSSATTSSNKPPFMQLSKQLFLLEEVILNRDETSGWTGFTSLASLVEKAQQTHFGNNATFTLDFASLTAFSRGNSKSGYGPHHVMLPLPLFVFQNLLKRWEDIAPPELAAVIHRESIEQYLQEDGIIIVDYDLNAHHVHFTTHKQRGFVGTCTYQMRTPFDRRPADTPLTIQQQLYLLVQLAFYSGIGYKTAMGMGQVRLLTGNNK